MVLDCQDSNSIGCDETILDEKTSIWNNTEVQRKIHNPRIVLRQDIDSSKVG